LVIPLSVDHLLCGLHDRRGALRVSSPTSRFTSAAARLIVAMLQMKARHGRSPLMWKLLIARCVCAP